jgi:DNA polymerase I
MQFTENTILFGADPTPGIVAVEPSGDRAMKIYRRDEGGALRAEEASFQPFLWLKENIGGDVELIAQSGELDFRVLARCRGWRHFQDLRASLKENNTAHFAYADPVQQYLAESGRTLFKDLVFEDLRRMQVDIETYCAEGFEFPSAERESDHLMAIAISDSSGWEEFILIDRASVAASEKAALEKLTALIHDRDPDVIEGHNLFKFDLPYLITRAKLRKVKLAWGRDGSIPLTRASRVQIAERTIAYPKCEVFGRHVVDTYLLAQFYDVGTRELEGFGLKDVAKHFGVEGGGAESAKAEVQTPRSARTYLSGRGIQEAYVNDPKSFASYALDDVRETRAISDLLSRSYFTQAQIFPYNFQDVIVRGNATKIDALFLREYLRRAHAIPEFPVSRGFEGGYTDIFFTGVAKDVWHCDVASLYPSVMLRFDCFPVADQLGIFRGLLGNLRSFRLEAKARMREAEGKPDRVREYNTSSALQATFKILINSFYGYLGFPQAHFGDFDAAATVTAKGRELLRAMVDWLRERGARVIEIDTDGIYFVPPDGATEKALHEGLSAILPEGIEVEFDARYAAMFSYKAKNYALLKADGSLLLKGGALKSRGLELFQREYLESMIRLLLEDRAAEIPALRDALERAIRERSIPIEELAKNDTLQDSLGQYQKKISGAARNRSAAYELALKSGRDYQPGDQIKFYITGTKKNVAVHQAAKMLSEWKADARDENVEYYVAKLNDLADKYAEFHPARPADNAQGSLF